METRRTGWLRVQTIPVAASSPLAVLAAIGTPVIRPQAVTIDAGIGRSVADFTLADTSGRPVSLHAFQGKTGRRARLHGDRMPGRQPLYAPPGRAIRGVSGQGGRVPHCQRERSRVDRAGGRARPELSRRVPRPEGSGKRRRRPAWSRADVCDAGARRTAAGFATGVRSTTSMARGNASRRRREATWSRHSMPCWPGVRSPCQSRRWSAVRSTGPRRSRSSAAVRGFARPRPRYGRPSRSDDEAVPVGAGDVRRGRCADPAGEVPVVPPARARLARSRS